MNKNKKNYRHKLIVLFLVFLSFSSTINILALANTFSVSDSLSIGFGEDGKILQANESEPCSVGFGKDGTILLPTTSSTISVGINSPAPVITTSNPLSLPPIEGEKNIQLSGEGFTENSKFYLVKESLLTPVKNTFLNTEKVSLDLNITDTQDTDITLQAINKNFTTDDSKSNLYQVPIGYSAPILTDTNGESLVNIAPTIGVAPQIVTFNAKDVVNPDDIYLENESMLSYLWSFGDSETSVDQTTTHSYKDPGTYLVSLTVENENGKTAQIEKEIEIREKNFAPDGSFETSLSTGDVPQTVQFTSNITDKENDEVTYLWDFGDGQTSTEINPSHIYTIPGRYNPKLIVTDIIGAKTTITSNFLTFLPPNNLPVLKIASVPEESTLMLTTEGLFRSEVQFLSNGTYDPDGEELTYNWDFGDGFTSNEANPKHTYEEAGDYTAKLTVTDPRGGQDISDLAISVLKPKPNVVAIINETSGNAPFEVAFNGTSSQDYDGMSVSLKWDFGDGTSQTVDSTESSINHTYQDPGVYLVTLTATTPDNRFSITNPGSIIVGPSKGPVGKITKIEGDEKGVAGEAKVKLSALGSFDPLDSNQTLNYMWSWSANTWDANGNLIDISNEVNVLPSDSPFTVAPGAPQIVHIGEVFKYTFTTPGQYTPVLVVENALGEKTKVFGETYTITPEQAPIAVAKITSEKTIGKVGLKVSFDGSLSYDPKANGGLKILTWNFGDGEQSTEVSPEHIYNQEGTFTPTLVIVDNENNVGFAQAQSIKITNEPALNDVTLQSRTIKLQTTDETEEEINQLIQSMMQEALDSYALTDNVKPEIGPVTLEPKTVKQGEYVNLSAFLRDNIGLSSFGYALVNETNEIITEKVIDLVSDEDKIIKDNHYVQENILIPASTTPGHYKLKLTATDTNNNQIAKAEGQEEISIDLEVIVQDSSSAAGKLIEPTSTEEVVEVSTRKARTLQLKPQNDYNLHIREEKEIPSKILSQIEDKTESKTYDTIKLQTISFDVTSISSVINPWISFTPSNKNSLKLEVIAQGDGYIEIGTKGSLKKDPYFKWITTNIYVDNKKVGNIAWLAGARISFTSNQPNITKSIQFRPVDRNGNELSSNTWTTNNFTFTKIIRPEITSSNPTQITAGRGAFDLVIHGNNFNQLSKIVFHGTHITPYASSSTVLIATIPADLVKSPGQKYLYVQNSDGSNSLGRYLVVKQNESNICSTNTLPQTLWGADARTILSGNKTYLTSPTATIEGNGSITIPFCLDNQYEVKTSINLTHYKYSSSSSNIILFYLDGGFIGGDIVYGTEHLSFDNLNSSLLNPGTHSLEIRFHAPAQDKLEVRDITFSHDIGPVLNDIEPRSVALEGLNRTLTLYGSNFTSNTNVYINGTLYAKNSVSDNQITITLPETFDSPGTKSIILKENNKESTIHSLVVRDNLEIINGSFIVSPSRPFPGNSFNIELKATDMLTEGQNVSYKADIAVYDPDGKLVTIPNISSYATTTLSGVIESQGSTNKTIRFNGSIPLSINAKPGNYKVIASVQRDSSIGTDYSDIEAIKHIQAIALGINYSDSLVSSSHRLTFTPQPAVKTVFGIEENSSENIGFVRTANKIIQHNQEIKYKVQISSGTEHLSKLRFNFKSGDGRETGLISSDSATFVYINEDTSSTTPFIYYPKLEIFWVDSDGQTQIATHNGPTVFVYPDYRPIAKARVLSEQYDTYSATPPLLTAFIDDDSYDPNQRFSNAIDFVDPIRNTWQLYELIFNDDDKLTSLPIDAKISEDKKTFISGNINNPGSYYAKLTVKDNGGQTDTASTESVTLAKPSQRVIVFASTDPTDQKVYDPHVILSGSEGSPGVPVKFTSNVTVLSGAPVLSYKWDFGDGSCTEMDLPSDCTSPNPTHHYFDRENSFNGNTFTDRKSVTPKLTVVATFPNGKKEKWEASAGTITFNSEPNFVLVDISPDTQEGIVPFTVSFMIDPNTAKQVNATVSSYEIDYGDNVILSNSEESPIESGSITFDELINKTFTHTYTIPGTYTPKLTLHTIDEKSFEFNVPQIVAGGTGVAEDISGIDDGFTLEKEQGDYISFESEILMGSISTPFKWQIVDEENEIVEQNSYDTVSKSNDVEVNYSTLPGSYNFRLVNDNNTNEKNFTLITKDFTPPTIEELDLLSGNIVALGEEFTFKVTADDNSKLMSLNWSLVNSIDQSIVFQGHNELNDSQVEKNITFTIPANISQGDYNLIIEVIDIAGNKTISSSNFTGEITVVEADTEEITNITRDLLTATISIFASGASETTSILPQLLSALGFSLLENILKGAFGSEPSFNEKLEDTIKDFGKDYTKSINKLLHNQICRTIKRISKLDNLTDEGNRLKATKLILEESSKANKLLSNLNKDLSPGQRLTELNTQGSNVTVVKGTNGLELKPGGDRTKEFDMSFYLPKLLNATEKAIKSAASNRAHLAVSILFDNKDLSNIYGQTIDTLVTEEDQLDKLLDKAYLTIERNDEEPLEKVNTFLSGHFMSINITKLSDFATIDSLKDDQNILISYTQRLLQDIGINGNTNGTFSNLQLETISSLVPSMTTDITPFDLQHLRIIASKSRSTYIGLRTKKLLTPFNREGAYETFIGTLVGKLASGTTDNAFSWADIINNYKTQEPNINAVNFILSKQVDSPTILKVSKEISKKTIGLLIRLLPGERRNLAIQELMEIATILENYSKDTISNEEARENFERLRVLLKAYENIKEGNEDNIGVLTNRFYAKLNVVRKELKNKTLHINNNEIAAVRTGVPLKLVLKIAGKDLLSEDQRASVIKGAAKIVSKRYRNALGNGVDEDKGINTNDEGKFQSVRGTAKARKLAERKLKRILREKNPNKLNKLVKSFRLIQEATHIIDPDSIVFVVEADSIQEITPNKKETEVIDYLIQEINSRLNPGLSSNITVPENLKVIIDKDISASVIEVRKVKEILKDVFVNTYKDQVFLVEDTEAKVNNYFGDEWLVEIGEDTVETFDGELFTLSQREFVRRNLIEEVQSITDEDIQSLQEIGVFREEIEPIPIVNPLDAIAQAAECILSMSGQPNNDPDPTILSVKIIGPEIVTKENSAFPLKVQVNGSMGQYTVMATAGANTTAEQTYSTDTTAVLNGLISPQKGQSQEIKVEVTDIAGSTVTTIANVTVPDVMIKIPQFVPINGQAAEGSKSTIVEVTVLPEGTNVPLSLMSYGNISTSASTTTSNESISITASDTHDSQENASGVKVSYDNSTSEKIYSSDNNLTITDIMCTVFEATVKLEAADGGPDTTFIEHASSHTKPDFVLLNIGNQPIVDRDLIVTTGTLPQGLAVEFDSRLDIGHFFMSSDYAVGIYQTNSPDPKETFKEKQTLTISFNGTTKELPEEYNHESVYNLTVVNVLSLISDSVAAISAIITPIQGGFISVLLGKLVLGLKEALKSFIDNLIVEAANQAGISAIIDPKPSETPYKPPLPNPINFPLSYSPSSISSMLSITSEIELTHAYENFLFVTHSLATETTSLTPGADLVNPGTKRDFEYNIRGIENIREVKSHE